MRMFARQIAVVGTTIGVLGAAAGPASAAVPGGSGLVEYGVFDCAGLGEHTISGPGGFKAAKAFSEDAHLILIGFTVTFTPTVGEPITISKSYGKRAALEPRYTCTGHFVEPDGTSDVVSTVALVPPR